MFNKPVKDKYAESIKNKGKKSKKKEDKDDGEAFIENSDQYDDFTKHPDTTKIFTSEKTYVGESTFAEIFVNCAPEKTKYMG